MLSPIFISIYCLFMFAVILVLFVYFHSPLWRIENKTLLTAYTIGLYLIFIIAINSLLVVWQAGVHLR